MTTTEELKHLFAPFPQEDIHWRSQSLTRDGSKAMALAYIDARNVMDRLDQIVGSENWQDTYSETQTGRVISTISIRVGDEWISKSDGAGATGMEGEKGGISDAFKRAAVKWGIGRYLYEMPAPWVPCESYERNGKFHWKKWAANPWDFVSNKKPKPAAQAKREEVWPGFIADIDRADTMQDLDDLKKKWREKVRTDNWPNKWIQAMPDEFAKIEDRITTDQEREPELA